MFIFRCAVIALVVSGLGMGTVWGAESPVSAFPKQTSVLIRLKTPQKTLQKAGELAVKVDRQEGMKVQVATPMLGLMISNPMLKGVDLNSDWWIGVFPQQAGDPGVVFAIPATDAQAFQDAVAGNYEFQTFEKWLIYTDHEPTAGLIKNQLAGGKESVGDLLDQSATAVWDEADLSLFVNVPELLKIYRGPFEQGVEQANDFIEQMPNLVPSQQEGMDMKAIADMYAAVFNGLVQGVRDARGCTAGLSISEDGLALSEYVKFADGSKSAKQLAEYKPTSLELMEKLPAKKLAYGAAELDMGTVVRWGMEYSLKMYAEGDTVKQKQVKELLAEYEKLEFGGMAMSYDFGDPKQGAVRITAISEVEQPEKVRQLAERSTKLMSNTKIGGMKMETSYEAEAETYGNLKADITQVKYEVDPTDPTSQMQIQMNNFIYGPEGMITRTVYLKDRMAQTIGGGKEDAQALLDALEGKNTAGDEEAYQATRKKLPAEANLIGMVDVPGFFANAVGLAIQAGAPVPIDANDLEKIRGERSYLGFSLVTTESALSAKTIVPLPTMQGIARMVKTAQDAEQQQPNF